MEKKFSPEVLVFCGLILRIAHVVILKANTTIMNTAGKKSRFPKMLERADGEIFTVREALEDMFWRDYRSLFRHPVQRIFWGPLLIINNALDGIYSTLVDIFQGREAAPTSQEREKQSSADCLLKVEQDLHMRWEEIMTLDFNLYKDSCRGLDLVMGNESDLFLLGLLREKPDLSTFEQEKLTSIIKMHGQRLEFLKKNLKSGHALAEIDSCKARLN